jgi:hypothetical protein
MPSIGGTSELIHPANLEGRGALHRATRSAGYVFQIGWFVVSDDLAFLIEDGQVESSCNGDILDEGRRIRNGVQRALGGDDLSFDEELNRLADCIGGLVE